MKEEKKINNTEESKESPQKSFFNLIENSMVLNGRIARLIESNGKVENDKYEFPELDSLFDEIEKDVLRDPEFYGDFKAIFESRENMEAYVMNLTVEDLFIGKIF